MSILPLKYGRKNGALIQWDVDFDDLPIVCVNLTIRKTKDENQNDTSFEICSLNSLIKNSILINYLLQVMNLSVLGF